jgi:hypothetical protein
MPFEKYLTGLRELGFSPYIAKEETLIFSRYGRERYIQEKSDFNVSSPLISGFEEEDRKISSLIYDLRIPNLNTEILDTVYFSLKGGPRIFDLIYLFVFDFFESTYYENYDGRTYKRIVFHVPLGKVCSISSEKLRELIPKLFYGGYEGDLGYAIVKASETCYIREELKTQLIAELMEELEKEIE